jgi:hypothetical protein
MWFTVIMVVKKSNLNNRIIQLSSIPLMKTLNAIHVLKKYLEFGNARNSSRERDLCA